MAPFYGPFYPDQGDTVCAICRGEIENPWALECGHRFCTACIVPSMQAGNIGCPTCRRLPTRVQDREEIEDAIEQAREDHEDALRKQQDEEFDEKLKEALQMSKKKDAPKTLVTKANKLADEKKKQAQKRKDKKEKDAAKQAQIREAFEKRQIELKTKTKEIALKIKRLELETEKLESEKTFIEDQIYEEYKDSYGLKKTKVCPTIGKKKSKKKYRSRRWCSSKLYASTRKDSVAIKKLKVQLAVGAGWRLDKDVIRRKFDIDKI